MIFIEFDLSGAEWVVVAYLAEDMNMLSVVMAGKSPHVVTGALISGAPEEFVEKEHKLVGSQTDPSTIAELRNGLEVDKGWFLPRTMSIRQAGKKSNHGLNYGMKYRRFAFENEMLEADASPIVSAYTSVAYPGIPKWWASIRKELRESRRCLTNCFGRKVRLLGEWGDTLFNAAYSFKPQSTVVDVCNKGMINCYKDESLPMILGAQVHDSLLLRFRTPTTRDEWLYLAAHVWTVANKHMKTLIVYNNRAFTLGVDAKLGVNWGKMEGFKISKDITETADAMRLAYNAVRTGPELVGAEEEQVSSNQLGRQGLLLEMPS